MKIQKPTVGRVVELQSPYGPRAGFIQGLNADNTVEISYLGLHDETVHHGHNVRYSSTGEPGTWRYPPRCEEFIVVDDSTERLTQAEELHAQMMGESDVVRSPKTEVKS